MSPIVFPESNKVFGENQPEYLPLPAHYIGDPNGTLTCCWQLTWRERLRLLFTGKLWQQIMTFRSGLQPQLLSVEKPDMTRP